MDAVNRSRWLASHRRQLGVAFLAAALSLGATCLPPEEEPQLTKGFTVEDHSVFFPIDAQATHALALNAGPVDAAALESYTDVITCESCHSPGFSFNEFYCLRCHDRSPTRNLDASHGFVEGYVRNDGACLSCHADGRIPAPEPHPYFPIEEGALHNGVTNEKFRAREDSFNLRGCVVCHTSINDKTAVRCAECHAKDTDPTVDAVHAVEASTTGDAIVQASYEADRTNCKGCHAQLPVPGTMSGAYHQQRAFRAGVWPHPDVTDPNYFVEYYGEAPLSCADCHVAKLPAPQAYATDFRAGVVCDTRQSCLDCHQQYIDQGRGCSVPELGEGEGEPPIGEGEGEPPVGEGEGEPPVGEGEGEPPVGEGEGEPPVGEGEGEPPIGEGEGEGDGGCDDVTHVCFPIGATDVHNSGNPEFQAREAEFGATSCASCHTDVDAAPEEVRCAECHALDVPTVASVHELDTTVRNSFTAQPNDCKLCHFAVPVPDTMRAAYHKPRVGNRWPHPGATKCVFCHSADATPDDIPTQLEPFDYAANFTVVRTDTKTTCASCH